MDSTHTPGDALRVTICGDHALVCVQGSGTFKISPSLKQFAQASMAKGIHNFILDMHACEHMDSTFMGVLAGLAMRLRKEGHGAVQLINLSEQTKTLLQTLGLDHLLEFSEAALLEHSLFGGQKPCASGEKLGDSERDERLTLETMLQAHEDLVSASPDNLAKFTDVIAYLRQARQESA